MDLLVFSGGHAGRTKQRSGVARPRTVTTERILRPETSVCSAKQLCAFMDFVGSPRQTIAD